MDDNKITQNLVESLLKDRNSERRYRLIYRAGFLILFLFIILLMYLSSSNQNNYDESHVAVIEINGMIGSGGPVNVENIIPFVKNALNNKDSHICIECKRCMYLKYGKEMLKCPIRKRAGFNDEASEDYLEK